MVSACGDLMPGKHKHYQSHLYSSTLTVEDTPLSVPTQATPPPLPPRDVPPLVPSQTITPPVPLPRRHLITGKHPANTSLKGKNG